jgi:hypothetical protein
MTVERIHTGHQTRYAMRDGAALRCILAFAAELAMAVDAKPPPDGNWQRPADG